MTEKRAYTFVASFAVAYALAGATGIFRESPAPWHEILFSWPLLAASLALLVAALVSVVRRRGGKSAAGVLRAGAILLVVAGLWTSCLTRFSGEVNLTEGETFTGAPNEYLPATLYRGKLARFPRVAFSLEKLHPEFSREGQKVAHLRGDFIALREGALKPTHFTVTYGFPRFFRGVLLSLGEFAYAPRYELRDKDGTFLDSAFVVMKLFPPGSEDFFRLITPHTFYVQYRPGQGGETLHLRIVRNKLLLFDGDVKPGDTVPFDNGRLAFPEVRMGVRLTVVRDPGEPVALLGGLLLAASLVAGWWRGRRGRVDGDDPPLPVA